MIKRLRIKIFAFSHFTNCPQESHDRAGLAPDDEHHIMQLMQLSSYFVDHSSNHHQHPDPDKGW